MVGLINGASTNIILYDLCRFNINASPRPDLLDALKNAESIYIVNYQVRCTDTMPALKDSLAEYQSSFNAG